MSPVIIFATLGALLGLAASGVAWLCARPPRRRRQSPLSDAVALDVIRLARYFLPRLGVTDPDDIDDGSQQVAAWFAERGVSPRCALSTQVRRCAQTWARARRRRGEEPVEDADAVDAPSSADDDDADNDDLLRVVVRRAGLTRAQEDALLLSIAGLGPTQVAERLGVSAATARSRLFRARAKIRLAHPDEFFFD